jgi:predicted amidohydrolase
MHLSVALLQLTAAGRGLDANLTRGLQACRDAKAMGADVALFPEMWSIGYDLREGEDPEALAGSAIDLEHPYLAAFSSLAEELDMAIATTFLQAWSERPRNAVAIFDRHGELVLTYAKVHTCDWDQEAVLTPGDRFVAADLDTPAGTVRVGAMICFDIVFPEAARVLMLEGAELILVPNACPFEPWRMAMLQTRAIENMVGVALANHAGPGFDGHSCAYDPLPYPLEGEEPGDVDPTVARVGREEQIVLARFDLDRIRRCRAEETQGDAYRKPSAYGAIVRDHVRPPFVRPDARR